MPDDGPTSIGFSAPDSTQPVRGYRLPSWHWSRWTLGGDGNLVWNSSKQEQQERSRLSSNLAVNPGYEGFWESEKRRASLMFAPGLSLNTSRFSSDSEFLEQSQTGTDYALSLDSEGILREYVRGRTFLLADGGVDLQFSRIHEDEDEGPSETLIQSDVQLDARLGVGVGRVRVVTPVIRALRVRERLRAAAPGASMSDEDVQDAARQLARRPGYEAVYDRPDKTFWRDFFEAAGVSSGRSPFEAFYVADVLREPVGVRREGREVQIGASASYDRFLEREEENGSLVERSVSETERVGAFARGQWYRNLSLRHQIGADLNFRVANRLNVENDHRIRGSATGQWLWVLADRVRLDTKLRARLSYQRMDRGENDYRSDQRYILSSNLLFFVENSLSLSGGANAGYHYSEFPTGDAQSDLNLGMQFQVTYVLSRALN